MRQVANNATPTHRERGVTLVELIVAMFILTIVLAMVVRTLGDSTDARVSVQQDASGAQSVDAANEQLASDLRMVYNPNRDAASDKEILAGARKDSAGNVLNTREILMATPYQLMMVADVNPSFPAAPAAPAPECVIYRVDAQGSLWRAVSTDTYGCVSDKAHRLDLKRLVPGAKAVPNESRGQAQFDTIFTYQPSSTTPSVSFGYVILRPTAASDNCSVPPAVGDLTFAADFARLMSINMIAYEVRDTQPSLAQTRKVYDDTITLRSHATLAYRMSIGCGATDVDA